MRWSIKAIPEREKIQHLEEVLNVDVVIAQLLVQRGIETYDDAKNFFRPSLDNLHDPYLMKDMDKAVARIVQALTNRQYILVYGDYDVDGTTAVALMSSYLRTKTDLVTTYIPDRYKEGYGISFEGIDYAADNDIDLIIALDCGIKAIDKVEYANNKGVDVIICDHHRPGSQLPNATAVLDPKREDCDYPFKELCGCGVGFKLVQALASLDNIGIEGLYYYLDLVATAIGADIVPITGENRILAFYGLQLINSDPRPGFKAILQQTQKTTLTITDVVFIIAPRINAAGRMKHGNHAVTLLTETDYNLAVQYAMDIHAFNLERQETDQRITEEALKKIVELEEENRLTSVVYDSSWHKGVIGIVASRLTETYYRPTLVFTKSGDKLAASARSVKGFDIYTAIENCSDHLEQFGGHKYAAGLTLKEDQYEAFKQAFEDEVSNTIDRKLLVPEISVDLELFLTDINPRFYRILKQFAPFGPGNMTPVFMSKNIVDTGYAKGVGENDKHLKVNVKQGHSAAIGGIGFNLGHKLPLVTASKPFDCVYSIDENEWNGITSLQLKLRDIK